MVIPAIIDQLKLGSITNVLTRGNIQTYPKPPYVFVYDDYSVNSYYITDATIQPLVVDVHFPPGYINELNNYLESEIPELLNHKRLTDANGFVFQVYVTMYLSIMSEPNDDKSITGGNDDGTISRFRRIFVPRRGG